MSNESSTPFCDCMEKDCTCKGTHGRIGGPDIVATESCEDQDGSGMFKCDSCADYIWSLPVAS